MALVTLYLQRRDERRAGKLRLAESDGAESRTGNEEEYDEPDADIKKDVDDLAVLEVVEAPTARISA